MFLNMAGVLSLRV